MVSVIIPMYNAQNTILRCIDSVLNQTYKGNIEILIINDGSNDNSKEIVEDFIEKNISEIEIAVYNKKNGGVSSARNEGIKEAKGDFVALLDADDEWLPEKLENQLSILQKYPTIHFLGGLIIDPLKNNGELFEITLTKLVFKNYFQPSTVIFRKEVINKVGLFDESQKYAEEGNYFIRVSKEFRCFLLNQKVVNYGQGKAGFGVSGLSSNLLEMEKGELKNLNFALNEKYITHFTYIIAVGYSVLKFVRRILIVKLKLHV